MTGRWTSIAAAVLLLVLVGRGAVGASAQEPVPFRTRVDVVQLQVVVRDEAGTPVRGLGAADFGLRVDGRERPVQFAYEVDLSSVIDPPWGPEATAAPGELPSAARRRFLLLFDLVWTPRFDVLRAREAALAFVDQYVRPDDLVAVAAAHAIESSRLLVPFTTEHDAVRAALGRMAQSSGPGTLELPPEMDQDMASIMGGSQVEEVMSWVIRYLDQLRELASTLGALEGRKHVLLFSSGFSDALLLGQGLVRRALFDATEALQATDAVVHAVDPTGLRGFENGPEEFEPSRNMEVGDGHSSLLAIASETGGEVIWNRSELAPELAEVARMTEVYYVIGYRLDGDDPETVGIDVSVRREGARVALAPRRLSPPPSFADMTEAQRQLQFADALAGDDDRPGLRFEVRPTTVAIPGRGTRHELSITIPAEQIDALRIERGESAVEIELAAFARNDLGRTVAGERQLAATEAPGDFHIQQTVDAPPGACRLRILLRDRKAGHLAARTLEVC